MKNEKSKVIQHANLASWIIDFISKEDILPELIANPVDSIKYFYRESSFFKSDYCWEYAENKDFEKKAKACNTLPELNYLLWKYITDQIGVYQVLTLWRSEELLSNSIRLLNLKELNASAVIARSLLELSVKYFVSINLIKGELRKINEQNYNFKEEIVSQEVATRLEDLIAKVTFADKENLWKEESLNPKSIMNELNWVDRIYKEKFQKKFIRKLYSELCEITHPNALGYLRYVQDNPTTDSSGFIKIKINKRNTSGGWPTRITRLTLSSLAWSSEALISSTLSTNKVKNDFFHKYLIN